MDITFNGISLSVAFGNPIFPVYISHPPEIVVAEPDLSIVHVPGKNGDIIYDDGSYKNVTVKYEISAHIPYGNVYLYSKRLSRWLYPRREDMYTFPGTQYPPHYFGYGDYFILQDGYSPDWYRLARTVNVQPVQNINQRGVKWDVSFYCRPEKFLQTRFLPISFTTASGTIDIESSILNPYNVYPLRPMIRVAATGSGAFAIYNSGGNLYRVEINNYSGILYLDSDAQEAMLEDGTSANQYITLTGVGSFPVIENNGMLFAKTGDITSVAIWPRPYVL